MAVIEINDNQYESMVLKERICVLEFYAPWCKPCVEIKDNYQECSEIFKDQLPFYAIDVSKYQETSTQEDVTSWPTFQFYKNGRMYHSYRGAPVTLDLKPIIEEGLERYKTCG